MSELLEFHFLRAQSTCNAILALYGFYSMVISILSIYLSLYMRLLEDQIIVNSNKLANDTLSVLNAFHEPNLAESTDKARRQLGKSAITINQRGRHLD
jgi:hypothetical protein